MCSRVNGYQPSVDSSLAVGASARLTKLRERQLCPAALQDNYVLPLCKRWLKVVVETDVEEVGSIVEMGTYPAYDVGHVRWRRNRRRRDPADARTGMSAVSGQQRATFSDGGRGNREASRANAGRI